MFKDSVYRVVESIQPGCVRSYGDVAAAAGSPRAARQVGQIAKRGPSQLPWHRVVKVDGSLAAGFAWGGAQEQQSMLESEGIAFTKAGKIKNFHHHRNCKAVARQDVPPLIVVVGETASGKSALSMKLAQRFNGEIICADAWTVRKKLDIGTAKPSKRDQETVRHHLLDIIEPNEDFTAAAYKDLALKAIADITSRGKLPIMVGGTFLYVDAVVRDYSFTGVGSAEQRDLLNRKTIEELLEIIKKNNYDAEGIDIRNKRRLVRLIESNGERPTRGQMRPNTLMIGVARSRTELRARMEQRVERMFAIGLKHEVGALVKEYGWGTEALKAIGYREWQDYFKGEQSRAETKRKIVRNTLSKLAKRQRAWFKKNKQIVWTDSFEQAKNVVENFLSK